MRQLDWSKRNWSTRNGAKCVQKVADANIPNEGFTRRLDNTAITDPKLDTSFLSMLRWYTQADVCYALLERPFRSKLRGSEPRGDPSAGARDWTLIDTTLAREEGHLDLDGEKRKGGESRPHALVAELLHPKRLNPNESQSLLPLNPPETPSASALNAQLMGTEATKAVEQRWISKDTVVPRNRSICVIDQAQGSSLGGDEKRFSVVYCSQKTALDKRLDCGLPDSKSGHALSTLGFKESDGEKHQLLKAVLLILAIMGAAATSFWDRYQRGGQLQDHGRDPILLPQTNSNDPPLGLGSFTLRTVISRLLDYHPSVLMSGVFANVTALTAYYHLQSGSKYRDLLLVAVFVVSMALGYFIMGLDVQGVFLQVTPWAGILGLVFCS